MADFVLKKRRYFEFALEEDTEKIYRIPVLKSLELEEIQNLTEIDDEKDLTKKGNLIREFVFRYAPELKEKNLAGMQFFDIFNAYATNNGKELGESSASADS